jgi:hypothetical protein
MSHTPNHDVRVPAPASRLGTRLHRWAAGIAVTVALATMVVAEVSEDIGFTDFGPRFR